MALRAGCVVAGWIAAVLLGGAAPAAAQRRVDPERLQFARYDARGGLSHNTVTLAAHLDRRGFLWVGTIDGLNRFDGVEYVVYRHDDHDPSSLSDGFIHTLAEDADGALWVGTRNGGLNRYDWETDRFTRYRHDPADPGTLPSDYVMTTVFDVDGRFWVGTYRSGFGVFDTESGRFRRVELSVDGQPTGVLPDPYLYRRGDGDLWVATEAGLYRVAAEALRAVPRAVPAGAAPVVVPARFVPLGAGASHVIDIVEAGDGRVWVGTRMAGLFVLDTAGRVVAHGFGDAELETGYVTALAEIDGWIWAGTPHGLRLVEPATGRVVSYLHRRDDAAGLSHDNVTSVRRDGQGRVWVGTWGGGFNRVRPVSPFALVRAHPDHPAAHGFVTALHEDSTGAVWVGAAAGLHRLRLGQADVQDFRPGPSLVGPAGVWRVEEGRSAFWAGTESGGLFVAPKAGGALRFRAYRHDPQDPDSPASDNVRVVLEDRAGRLWIGHNDQGLDLVLDAAALAAGRPVPFIHFRHDSTDAASLGGGGIRSLYQDRRGDVWVGTARGGACRVRLAGGTDESPFHARFACLRHEADQPNSLSHDNVQAIYQDTTGTYWFGTLGGGLVAWDEATGTFTRFGRARGLPNEVVYGILDDGHGALWLTTDNGLARFSLRDSTFRTFRQVDGLQYDEFNTGAWHRGHSGRLYVGGPHGFNHFDPARFTESVDPPPVYLTGFDVFDTPYRTDRSVAALAEIVLPHDANFVTFAYAAPAFDDPERVRYSYTLEGVDPEPVRAGSRRFASYTKLDPGRYVFRVRAFYADAAARTSEATIRLVVTPPWWATWWFYGLTGLAVLGAVVAVVRYVSTRKWKARVRALEVEHKLQMERERISRDLHDHVGAQLTSLVSGLDLARRYEAVAERPRREELLSSLQAEARQTIGQLRGTIWALSQQAVSLDAFTEQLRRYAADRNRFLDGCHIAVATDGLADGLTSVPAGVPAGGDGREGGATLAPTQALNLFRIVQEAVQNAVKHAGARTIRITVGAVDGILALCVRDDGTFKPPEAGHEGIGLGSMRKRAAEIGATLDLTTDAGTTVAVRLPLGEPEPGAA